MIVLNDQGGSVMSITEDVVATLRAQDHGHAPIICLEGNGTRPSHRGIGYSDSGEMFTLNTIDRHAVCYPVDSHPMDGRISIAEDGVVPTLTDKLRKGSADGPLVLIYRPTSCNCTGYEESDTSASLTTKYHYGQGGDAALIVQRSQEDMRAYAVENHPADSRVKICEDDKVQTLSSRMGTGGNNVPLVMHVKEGEEDMEYFDMQRIGEYGNSGTASTLKQRDYKDHTHLIVDKNKDRKYIIRRLTPNECAKLQGFPEWWTEGVEGSDSAKYKMWGNGVCLQNCHYILNRIVEYEKRKQNSPPVKETPYTLYKYSGYMGEIPTDPNKYIPIAGNIADDDEACKIIRKIEDPIPYLRIMGPDIESGSYWFDYGSYTMFYFLTKKYLGE